MGNSLKQVYCSLYINEGEIQMLVGEYFNTRFNITRVEKAKTDGIVNFKITDYDGVCNLIKGLKQKVSSNIGASLKKTILVLPAFNYKRIPLRVSVVPNGGILTKKDVARALTSALKTEIDDDLIIVNASIVKYILNGISTRRLPENEVCDEVILDVDLLCADKEIAFDYLKVVTDAGLEVLDITLDTYSICKEAVLLEQSLSENIILLDIGNYHSYMSLLSKGKLGSTEIIGEGLNSIAKNLISNINAPIDTLLRLVKFNVDFKSEYPSNPVFAWSDDKDQSHSLTVKELNDFVLEPLSSYVDKIVSMCKPIIDNGKTMFFLTGEGSKMNELANVLRQMSNVEVKQYYPETIGIRDSALCSIYGSFFVYREKALLNNINVCCVDIAEYDSTVDQRKIDVEGESITTKIKKMFEQYRDKEDN